MNKVLHGVRKGVSVLTIFSMVMSFGLPLLALPSFASAAAPLPDLTVTKTNDASPGIKVGDSFNWIITINNVGDKFANFTASDQVVLRDQLPSTGATYPATPTVSQTSGVDGDLDCSIDVSDVLMCIPSSSAYKIPEGDSVTVTIPVTVTSAGTLTNGSCSADADVPDNIDESDETNNECNLGNADYVIIEGINATASITAENKIYDGTTSATTSCSLIGVVSPDVVTCSATSATF